MISIQPAYIDDALLLSQIAPKVHLESHGHSAKAEHHEYYISRKLSPEAFSIELSSPENIYHLIYVDEQPAGYSKIILNVPHPEIAEGPVTKLERLYLLKEFYGMNAGKALYDHNVKIACENHQLGMWLNVWMENHRAIAFYVKQGFTIIGRADFEVSPTHTNPNHVMYVKW